MVQAAILGTLVWKQIRLNTVSGAFRLSEAAAVCRRYLEVSAVELKATRLRVHTRRGSPACIGFAAASDGSENGRRAGVERPAEREGRPDRHSARVPRHSFPSPEAAAAGGFWAAQGRRGGGAGVGGVRGLASPRPAAGGSGCASSEHPASLRGRLAGQWAGARRQRDPAG